MRLQIPQSPLRADPPAGNETPINTAFIREVGFFRWTLRTAIRQFYKRIIRRDHRMKLPTGEWLTLPVASRFASEAFITHANVDWGSEALFASLLTGRGAFLDVGAHIGYYSLYMFPLVPAVYSFEPDPRARFFLEQNAHGHSGLEIVPHAVGARLGHARFTLDPDAALSHLSRQENAAANQIEVEVVTIDSFVHTRSLTIEAIKIDVEGHDLEVLQGALEVLRDQQPLVLTEVRPSVELFAVADQVAYRVFAFVRHPRTRARRMTELFADVPAPGETKMLFLVPARVPASSLTLEPH